ncbi:hypothetical protein DY218_11490 [Streptomyces triticagri]|uniref:UL36 very large tegument protein n=1 Tax=Streptomyces triticagri TaxID=2293568 RepID=A0A372M6P6_9ACTN|nr:hypothetical protein [Streptomyces triticagri]RFU86614.1 hypothetical protein DY218_11490 [Streptomyces triticagri]
MAGQQLPGSPGEFGAYLQGLVARLDAAAGWCGVFWQRDPDGMSACFEGREVPPWDVVESLIHDLAESRGRAEAERETVRARALHRAAVVAHDAGEGARKLLGERLDVMRDELRYAAGRQQELGAQIHRASPEEAERLSLELAWARDDHERASARCTELQSRLDELDLGATAGAPAEEPPRLDLPPAEIYRSVDVGAARPAGGGGPGQAVSRFDDPLGVGETYDRVPGADSRTEDELLADSGVFAVPDMLTVSRLPEQRNPGAGCPRGARFAGLDTDQDYGAEQTALTAEAAVPAQRHAPSAPSPDTPRGARYAGMARSGQAPEPAQDSHGSAEAHRATARTVSTLIQLRTEGRGGEAHAILCEALDWPAVRLPLLAAELHRAGLGADWATFLWEAASMPPEKLAAAADALAAVGRTEDCRHLLRQGTARPASEIAEAVLALDAAGRTREADGLLDACIRARTPGDCAAIAATDPPRLVPRLLDAATDVSGEHHWDLTHALRVAGLTA